MSRPPSLCLEIRRELDVSGEALAQIAGALTYEAKFSWLDELARNICDRIEARFTVSPIEAPTDKEKAE